MIDFVLGIFSSVLQMDMRNHHDIPFASPLGKKEVVNTQESPGSSLYNYISLPFSEISWAFMEPVSTGK